MTSKLASGTLTRGAGAIIAKAASAATYLYLGAQFGATQFATVAFAFATANTARAFSEAGIREVLVESPDATFVGSYRGATMLLGLLNSLILMAGSVLLLALHRLGAIGQGSALVVGILLVGILIDTLWTVRGAVLMRREQNRRLATVDASASIVASITTIVLVSLGTGPVAVAIAFVAGSITRAAFAMPIPSPVGPATRTEVSMVFKRVRPLLSARVAQVFLMQGDYLFFGIVLTTQELGRYYFSYQLVAQVGVLTSGILHSVLFPRLSVLVRERKSLGAELMEALSFITGLVTQGLAALILAFPLVDRLIWDSRWFDNLAYIVIFSIMYMGRTLFVIPKSLLLATGQFRSQATTTWTVAGSAIGLGIVGGQLAGLHGASIGVTLGTGLTVFAIAASTASEHIAGVWTLLGRKMALNVAFVLAPSSVAAFWLRSLSPSHLAIGTIASILAVLASSPIIRNFAAKSILWAKQRRLNVG